MNKINGCSKKYTGNRQQPGQFEGKSTDLKKIKRKVGQGCVLSLNFISLYEEIIMQSISKAKNRRAQHKLKKR